MNDRRPNVRKIAKRMLMAGLSAVLGLQLIFPLAARAQDIPDVARIVIPPGPGTPVVIVGDIYQEIKKQLNTFGSLLVTGGIYAIMNAFQVFSQRIAYDAAQRILTGDAGQYPLFWEQGYGDYIKNVALDAGNQFISSINSEVFNPFGFDLCTPIDPLKLQLSFGVRPIDQLKAKCTLAKIGSAWEQTKDALNTSKDVFDNIAPLYDPNASEINFGVRLHNQYLDRQIKIVEAAIRDRAETGGLKHVKDVISGNIKTPTQTIKDTLTETNVARQQIQTGQMNYLSLAGNAFRIGFTQLGILTASTFVNTLAVGLLQKLFEGLTGTSVEVSGVDLINPEAAGNRNVASARIVFSDLLTPNLFSSDQQDFVNELSGCPTPRGIWNCAMDDAFAVALRSVGETGAYTVGRASHVVLNGTLPSNPQFLHPDWELIPESEVKDNTDPSCYQRAYCASNLSKLRYARILPVGWELAANSPHNTKKNGKYITLGEVIRGFNVCNEKGEADSSHPWCNLVDPNWVLSAPPFQCKVKGFADTVFPGTQIRLQDCADAISCLKRDDRGKCTGGYGYCLAEKPTWRFTADQCLERFASCRTYTTRKNELVSYLRNTLDYGSCSKENVGCLWYSTVRDPGDPAGGVWLGQLAATSGPRVYFDGSVKPCSAANDGCTKLYEVQLGQPSLNLVPNGSFELTDENEGVVSKLDYWEYPLLSPPPDYVVPDPEFGAAAVDGGKSYAPISVNPTNALTSPYMNMAPVRNYTFSAFVRNATTTKDGKVAFFLALYTNTTGTLVTPGNFYRSAGCIQDTAKPLGFDQTIAKGEGSDQWQRLECSFVSNVGTAYGRVRILGSDILVDAIQLEETEKATAFVDGVATQLPSRHLKVPPEEFSCKGEKSDHPVCASYAKVCKQSDQGCQGYRDINNPTAPEIPATLSAVDFCPAICVGYAEYRKQPSTFDLGKNADERLNDPQDDTVAHFVPTFAQQCSIADVGCEEFTNVEAAAAGGEAKAYFNYVRACEKPNENTETFFTWEGSDTTGYQLRTWSLIHDTSETPNPPKLIQKTGPDNILKEPQTCNASFWQTGADPDCRQFFNADGQVFYAYFSQTVLSSPECTDFRVNKSNVADCGKTGGNYSPQSGECIYNVLPSESRVCRDVAAGCRAYIGTTGRNTTEVFSENFHATATAPFTFGDLSNESILVGDKSLKVTGSGTLNTATVFLSFPNQLYSLSFWAKTTSPSLAAANIKVDGQTIATFPMEVDWRRYEFGPFAASSTVATSTLQFANLPNATFLDEIRIDRLNDVSFVVKDSWAVPPECDRTPEGLPQPQAMLGCRAYRDRDNKTVTVRRFGHLCREEVIGCKAFVDTRNSDNPNTDTFVLTGTDENLKTTPESILWEDKYLGTATTTRQSDRFIYLIDDVKARCDASQASCRAFGKPNFRQDYFELEAASSSRFETVYLIDDITQYVAADGEPNMLCRKDELFCEEFKSGKITAYFRNPGNHACEWKDKVLLKKNLEGTIPVDGEYTGWFRTGTDVPCYPKVLSSGNTYLIQNSGDPGYVGWGGLCPAEQSECTEFRDANDHSDPVHPAGKPYFFIHNQRIDLKSCAGKVDLLSGCILFRDMSDVRLRYSTAATYAKSHAEGDTPQSPIDCVNDPDNQFCKGAGRCVNLKQISCGSLGCSTDPNNVGPFGSAPLFIQEKTNASCSSDLDCSFSNTEDPDGYVVKGTCQVNDANIILKVKLDRDCAQWLGCSTAETVFDPVQAKYVDVCTELQMCDVSKGANAGSFCANYVDRTKDPILKPGVFFSREVYVKRKVGFGETDYSGYTVPDQFQAADIQNRKVGSELFANTPTLANKFSQDYRLAAAISEKTGLVSFPSNENVPVDDLYPDLFVCSSTQTGRTGYFRKGIGTAAKKNRICYFPIDALSTRSVDVILDPSKQGFDPRNIQPLSDVFRQSADPKYDLALTRSFPPAECKAYPEADSPFPNFYVKDWDYTIDPFKKKEVAEGYESGNFCEYGEDCACSYRKVKFGGQTTKYYSPFGAPPPGGICVGGSKEGEVCVPGEKSTVSQGGVGSDIPTNPSEDPGCPGGRCADISDVVLVRGQFGQCLQRDYSRSIAGEPGRHPCLIWNPNPILSGTFDAAHYVPPAGYLPPVNAGEYYCLSHANPPFENIWSAESKTYWDDSGTPGTSDSVSSGDGANQFFLLPGKLSKFNYDAGYIAGQCGDLGDECGDTLEGDCNCHDGIGNEESEGFRDWTDVWRAADAGAQADIGNGSVGLAADGGLIDDKSCSFAEASCSAEECREEPLNSSCGEIWRFTILGKNIDGHRPLDGGEENPQAQRCLQANTDTKGEDAPDGNPGESGSWNDGIGPWDRAPDADFNLGRWIQTGRGLGRTYMEYFIPVKPKGVATWLYKDATKDEVEKLQTDAVLERNFAQFQFFVQGDDFSAACSIPPEYVEGVSVSDWGDHNAVVGASKQAVAALSRDFDGQLDRSKEAILVHESGKPIKEVCSGLNDGKIGADVDYAGTDGRCYYKVWETNYRMDGVSKFEWLAAESGSAFYERYNRYYSHERTCSKSGFSIRAVFENANQSQNDIDASEVTADQLSGPWKFIGFWITSCMVGHNMESHLYLGLRVKHADICTQLAQVIAPFSRESAAFADRVWANGSFVIPQLGYAYASGYPPYGSALATRVPGVTPLFQTGGPVENFSKIKPPTFLGSGVSYSSFNQSPLHKWAYLTNVFARVYRIYKYHDASVGRRSYVCVGGPNDGALCPTPGGDDWSAKVKEICGGEGACDTALTTLQTKNQVRRCNGLSGVNAGLDCGGGASMPSLDPVCHNAAMKRVGNTLIPQLTSCALRSGWADDCESDGQYKCLTGQNGCEVGKCYNSKTIHESYNGFGCAGDAVIPNSGCAVVEQNSKDCPKKITGVSCIADSFGPMKGHCGDGYEHARCDENSECVFGTNQWWGVYDDAKPKTELPPVDNDNNGNNDYAEWEVLQASGWTGKATLWTHLYPADGGGRLNAFLPTGYWGGTWTWPDLATLYVKTPYVFAGASRWAALFNLGSTDQRLKRWPSAHPVYANPNDVNQPLPYYRAGVCEGAQGAKQDPENYWQFTSDNDHPTRFFNYYAQGGSYALQVGQCLGGINDGQFCFNKSDIPVTSDWPHPNTCAPPAGTEDGECKKVATVNPDDSQIPADYCKFDNPLQGDKFSLDPDKDNNACTRSAGYKPRKDLCGDDLDNEKCLLGYDLRNNTAKQQSLDQSKAPAPTDVTAGFHNPIFLGLSGGNPNDYLHIAYYAPRPPTIAAPDLSRSCEAPGQCRISQVGGFSLENQSEGVLAFGGGKAQIAMRFYGWASHDQTPLNDIYIDWGDGTITKIEDARIKNRKPFCGVQRECTLVPGLTCNSDADCPPGGGKCAEIGTCSQNPTVTCTRHEDCDLPGKKGDKCNIREFFGNSDDACEANYFEFSHAYACDPLKIQKCGDKKFCSRNPNIECSSNGDCGVGDKCVSGIAPSNGEGGTGGCFDETKVACRFTPKVMLKDSWNWCTGECRAGTLVGNVPNDASSARARHVYGGCWDGTETKRNIDLDTPIMETAVSKPAADLNECLIEAQTKNKNIRPWIVFPGAVQIGTYK
ncbi:hypothetical protein HY479_02895 [Candidatus Uhrbacteria bacterium]|nr:hypothetical protein [Candidatus Uhrbacteria bacterium]